MAHFDVANPFTAEEVEFQVPSCVFPMIAQPVFGASVRVPCFFGARRAPKPTPCRCARRVALRLKYRTAAYAGRG